MLSKISKKRMRFFNILFVVIVNIFYMHLIDGASFNRSLIAGYPNKEQDDLEDVIKKEVTRFLSKIISSRKCDETALTCELCVTFQKVKKPKICLVGQFHTEKLDASVKLTYDSKNIWGKKIQVNSVCTELPEPLNNASICVEAYNTSILAEPAMCLRMEITFIFHILSIDFNCIKFERGKGLFFDSSIESKSKALININVHEGDSIVSFNNPVSWKMAIPYVKAILAEQIKPLKLENTLMQTSKKTVTKSKRE